MTQRMNIYTQAFVPDVLEQFETDCRLLCVCGDGRRSELAAQQLADDAGAVDYIDGGLNAWAEQSLELEVEDDGGLVGSAGSDTKPTYSSTPSSTRGSSKVHRSKSSDRRTPFFDFEGHLKIKSPASSVYVPSIRDGPSTYVNLSSPTSVN